jgi:hypothetical protein
MPALPRISWCADKGFLYFDIERNILYLFYIATGSLHRIWDSLSFYILELMMKGELHLPDALKVGCDKYSAFEVGQDVNN